MQFELSTSLATGLQAIDFNYEAIKAALDSKLEIYRGLIVSEDGVAAAKKDRAELNNLKKELEQGRINVKKEILKPYDAFAEKVAELIAMIDKPTAAIDEQIKAFEDTEREKRRADLLAYYGTVIESDGMACLLPFSRILNPVWLNKSTSMKKAKEQLKADVDKHTDNVKLIREMKLTFEQEVLRVYLDTFDMTAALRRKGQLEAQAATIEAITPEEPAIAPSWIRPIEPMQQKPDVPAPVLDILDLLETPDEYRSVDFHMRLTQDEQKTVEQFLREHGIQFKVVFVTAKVDG